MESLQAELRYVLAARNNLVSKPPQIEKLEESQKPCASFNGPQEKGLLLNNDSVMVLEKIRNMKYVSSGGTRSEGLMDGEVYKTQQNTPVIQKESKDAQEVIQEKVQDCTQTELKSVSGETEMGGDCNSSKPTTSTASLQTEIKVLNQHELSTGTRDSTKPMRETRCTILEDPLFCSSREIIKREAKRLAEYFRNLANELAEQKRKEELKSTVQSAKSSTKKGGLTTVNTELDSLKRRQVKLKKEYEALIKSQIETRTDASLGAQDNVSPKLNTERAQLGVRQLEEKLEKVQQRPIVEPARMNDSSGSQRKFSTAQTKATNRSVEEPKVKMNQLKKPATAQARTGGPFSKGKVHFSDSTTSRPPIQSGYVNRKDPEMTSFAHSSSTSRQLNNSTSGNTTVEKQRPISVPDRKIQSLVGNRREQPQRDTIKEPIWVSKNVQRNLQPKEQESRIKRLQLLGADKVKQNPTESSDKLKPKLASKKGMRNYSLAQKSELLMPRTEVTTVPSPSKASIPPQRVVARQLTKPTVPLERGTSRTTSNKLLIRVSSYGRKDSVIKSSNIAPITGQTMSRIPKKTCS